jgi:predicted outer membrane repeat protein
VISANTIAAFGGCPSGSSGADTIVLPAGTYVLSIGMPYEDAAAEGDLDVTEPLTIAGAGTGSSIIDGGDIDRVLQVRPNAGVMTLTDLTVQNGTAPGDANGGGIDVLANDTLQLDRVLLTGNRSTQYGGAIHTNDAVFVISNSALTGNTAEDDSGAIDHIDGAAPQSTLTNVSIGGNTSGTYAGGLGIDNDQPVVLNNVTITGNTVTGAPTNEAGGIGVSDEPGGVTLQNTLLAGNSAPVGPDCTGQVASLGNNLIGKGTDCNFVAAAGDQVGTGVAPIDPKLGPLADNGGPTPTHALLKGSPAINAGGSGCASADQRGAPRKDCDIGAYERVLCQKRVVNRVGTSGNDKLKGTGAKDGLLALGGKDKLNGKGGADGLCGGPGKDALRGGGGNDRLNGGPGKDLCVGGAGNDKAKGCETERSL